MTKNRIKKDVKAIADAHIQARVTGVWNPAPIKSRLDLLCALKKGHTFEGLLTEIEARNCSITSILTASVLDHASNAYRQNVYTGFKSLLQ